MNDADRYIWLLAHMGLVEQEARDWDPRKHKPFLKHLQDYIDRELITTSRAWIEEQRNILNQEEQRRQIGWCEREEGYYKIYEPPKGSIVTRAFILCKYCSAALHPCGGPKMDAVCFKCYELEPELRGKE